MPEFHHERHKPLTPLERPRELIVACAPMRSNINLSRIVRVASCSGVSKVIACGTAKVIDKIARDGADAIEIEVHRTLAPVLKELKQQAYQLAGLEQTTNSQNLHSFSFHRKTVLVVGNERTGLADDSLQSPPHNDHKLSNLKGVLGQMLDPMFESLQEGLSSALKTLRGKGKLTESNMRDGLDLVEKALLEADVSYSVVKDFMARVTEQAVGEKVL